jgi:predicted metal-dependent hydrolase
VELLGQTLVVHHDSQVPDLESSLERWYRAQAAIILEHKAREFAAAFGVKYGRFSIRGQRTRWASCSHRGTLSFNWRLIMAPEPVVDYVVIHEVAHLKEMNHTRRFWGLVAERCPSWRQHKKWLDDHGTELAAVLSPPH